MNAKEWTIIGVTVTIISIVITVASTLGMRSDNSSQNINGDGNTQIQGSNNNVD
jgi:hypothetical protein